MKSMLGVLLSFYVPILLGASLVGVLGFYAYPFLFGLRETLGLSEEFDLVFIIIGIGVVGWLLQKLLSSLTDQKPKEDD
jgi:hypothetical protein